MFKRVRYAARQLCKSKHPWNLSRTFKIVVGKRMITENMPIRMEHLMFTSIDDGRRLRVKGQRLPCRAKWGMQPSGRGTLPWCSKPHPPLAEEPIQEGTELAVMELGLQTALHYMEKILTSQKKGHDWNRRGGAKFTPLSPQSHKRANCGKNDE